MSKGNWDTTQIPAQTGKRVIITGAAGGLGYETALELARAGAQVLVTGRNAERGRAAVERIRKNGSNANVRFERLDVASLASVRSFAARMTEEGTPIDVLVNNAGVMALPERRETEDGFEMQLGTNYLGHFALTAQLLPLMAKGARVVNLSSSAHWMGKIDLFNLQAMRDYDGMTAYAQSKLAMLMFSLELQLRSDLNGWNIMSIGAHPGVSRTELVAKGPAIDGPTLSSRLTSLFARVFGQSAAAGALPTLYAATAPDAAPGGYYGPDGFLGIKGAPARAGVAKRARDTKASAELWQISTELTGLSWPGWRLRAARKPELVESKSA